MKPGRGRPLAWLTALVVAFAVAASAVTVLADARTEYLVRLLRTSSTFRVRAQAALSLGRIQDDPQVVRALSEALRDDHPAVRTAAAASLEQIGDPSAIEALRAASRDRDSTVRAQVQRSVRTLERIARTRPRDTGGSGVAASGGGGGSGPARYYVGVGMPGSKVARLDRDALRRARQVIADNIRQIDGVRIAPDNESNREAQAALRRLNVSGFYIDSSIVQVEESAGGTRAVVSVIVGTYPGRDMRAMLQGAATVQGARGRDAQEQAIEGALRGALRRLPQALQAADARAAAP